MSHLPRAINKTLYSARMLIPFYLLYRMHVEQDKNKFTEKSEKQTRVMLRFMFSILGLMACCVPSILLPGAAIGFILTIVAMAYVPTIMDTLVKQCIRGVSYIQNYNNPEVINKTYQQKYQPYDKNDQSTYHAMSALYRYKQGLKTNPQGTFGGLSKEQQEQSDLINKAVKFMRHKSIESLWNPEIPPIRENRLLSAMTDSLLCSNEERKRVKEAQYNHHRKLWTEIHEERTGIPIEKHDFLRSIIN